jgi:hypothetical protein
MIKKLFGGVTLAISATSNLVEAVHLFAHLVQFQHAGLGFRVVFIPPGPVFATTICQAPK